MLFAWSSLLLVQLAGNALAAGPTTCYNRDGSIATGDYKPCPGTTYCCNTNDTCTTNGLCQNPYNHYPGTDEVAWWRDANGTKYANFTGLYSASTCTNKDFSGCFTRCTNSSTNQDTYLWTCDNAFLTNYCCRDPSLPLYAPQSCCKKPNALFQLDKPTTIPWNATVPSASTGSATTSSPTASITSGNPNAAADGGTPKSTTIGISVGVAVGVFLCLILLAILFWRVQALRTLLRRGARPLDERQPHHHPNQTSSGYEPVPSYHGNEKEVVVVERATSPQSSAMAAQQHPPATAPSPPAASPSAAPVVAEADHARQIYEMPENRAVRELP